MTQDDVLAHWHIGTVTVSTPHTPSTIQVAAKVNMRIHSTFTQHLPNHLKPLQSMSPSDYHLASLEDYLHIKSVQ
jgi:hypothetical protein